jgi:hypothetical protein
MVLEGAAVASDITYWLAIQWGEMMQAAGGIHE